MNVQKCIKVFDNKSMGLKQSIAHFDNSSKNY